MLVIFIIRTRGNPLRSRAHPLLTATSLVVVAVAVLLEGLQALTPDRSGNLLAALYGACGALAAALLATEALPELAQGDYPTAAALADNLRRGGPALAQPIIRALARVAEAAQQGMEYTKTIVATMGRAKTLGERALGHPDPGAVSMYLILHYMAEYVTQSEA